MGVSSPPAAKQEPVQSLAPQRILQYLRTDTVREKVQCTWCTQSYVFLVSLRSESLYALRVRLGHIYWVFVGMFFDFSQG